MLEFALRLRCLQDFAVVAALLSAWLSGNATEYLAVRETLPDNDHIHVYLQTSKNAQALRKSFITKFPDLKGNEGYSLKACNTTPEEYVKYCCKGAAHGQAPVVVCRQSLVYTPDRIAELHEAYWATNLEIQAAKRRRLLTRATVVEQVEAECKRTAVRASDREAIAKVYISLYVGLKKPISIFHAKSVLNTVSCLLEGGVDASDILAADIAARL